MTRTKANAGRRGRARRAGARKSTARPTIDSFSIEEATDSSPQTTPVKSSAEEVPATDSIAVAAPQTTPDAMEAHLSSWSVLAVDSAEPPPSTDEPVSGNDGLSGAQAPVVKARSEGESLNADPTHTDDSQLRQCEALSEVNPKETDRTSASPQPDQNPKNDDDTVSVAGLDTANDTNIESTTVEAVTSSPGKAKKMVKKKVMVVKKIIKKVPKKVVKGAHGSKVDETEKLVASGDAMNVDLSPNVTASLNVGDSKPDVSLKVEKPDGSLNSVRSPAMEAVDKKDNIEAREAMEVADKKDNIEASEPMEVVDNKDHIEESDAMEVVGKKDNVEASAAMEVVDKKDDVETSETMEVVDNKEAPEGMIDKNDSNSNGEADTEVEKEPLADSLKVVAVKDNDCGEQKFEIEVKEKENDGDAVAKGEDEAGEPVLFSGEMEAMERRKRRKTEIFIGGLDKDTKEEDIRQVFEQVGEVLEVRLLVNGKTRKNKGYAFLRYASAVDARNALEKFAKVEICGKQCGAAAVEGNDTIYLGNIDKKWKDEDIDKLLLEMGIEKIDKVTVMANPSNIERNRGFAFVEFETSRDAQIAFKRLQKNDVGKKHNLKVAWAQQLNEVDEQEMLKVKTVYAEFLPSSWDEKEVTDVFKKFGEIDNVVLARNLRTSKRKDFAFISYKSREAAISCIESFNHEAPNDDEAKVNVKVSLAKPMQKGKQPKQVLKPASKFPKEKQPASQYPKDKQPASKFPKEKLPASKISKDKQPASKFPKEKPKPYSSKMKSMHPRNKERLTVPHYGAHRAETSTNPKLVQVLREQAAWKQPQMGTSRGEFGAPRYDLHTTENSATAAELRLVQLMRERAASRQLQMAPSRGHVEMGYPNDLPGRKRPFMAMEADPLQSNMIRYPYPRLEHSTAAPSYSSLPPNLSSSAHSLAPHQHPAAAYESRSLYGTRDYPGNEIRDRRAYEGNYMYRRY